MINKLNYYLITLFIFGRAIQKYKGTWASLFTTLFLFLVIYFFKVPILIVSTFLLIILFYSFFAIRTCLGKFKDKDPQEIVIDEFIGQSIPIILYELFHSGQTNSVPETLQIYLWFFLL